MRTLIAGNWKMNGRAADLAEAARIAEGAGSRPDVDVLICPPATLIERMRRSAGAALLVGAQDCHAKASGAHTGDISAAMLADCGAAAVIVGHSERRADHGETDETVRAKAEAAIAAGLLAIVCVGETEAQRDAGQALDVVGRQLAGSVPNADPQHFAVAYEPVWAIGTGRTPGADDIVAMHAHIRGALDSRFGPPGRGVRSLYGGSLKPANAAEILALPEVDGGLIGGASLKAADFLAIVAAAPKR